MKFNQISGGVAERTQQALRSLAISEVMSQFPISPYAEFYSILGNADAPRKADDTMEAGDNRAINEDYTAKDNTPGFASVVLKMYGDKIKTDVAYERRGQDIGSQRAIDLANGARSIGRRLMDAFVNDDTAVNAKKFTGLKKQTDVLGRVAIFDTDNGGIVPTGNGNTERKQQDKFIEFLDAHFNDIAGGPDIMLCNGTMLARLGSIGRGYTSFTNVKDIYGKEQQVLAFRGVPCINAGFKASNTGLVIPDDITCGTSEDCTSLYYVKFGEATDVTFATNVGLDVKDLGVVGMNYVTAVEIDLDLAVLNANSVKRLDGIRLK